MKFNESNRWFFNNYNFPLFLFSLKIFSGKTCQKLYFSCDFDNQRLVQTSPSVCGYLLGFIFAKIFSIKNPLFEWIYENHSIKCCIY
jgi:hypothetical protein